MINEEQIKEIRHLLKESEKPLFFFDDDTDGLCSYLLLKKYIDRGKGVIVKSSPKLSRQYLHKIEEYRPDRVFVLDKPMIEQDFVDDAKVQIVWIDHHPPYNVEGVHYFNPRIENSKDGRPTSYWCYKIARKNLWIAMCGIIGDWHVPDFVQDFIKKYPDLLKKAKDPGQVIYETRLGKLTKLLNFILKGPTSEVNKCISILEKIESPYEILDRKTPKGKYIYKYYENIDRAYQKLLKEALAKVDKGRFLLYTYPMTKMSFSGDLANELMYRFPGKLVLIGRVKQSNVVVSIRSNRHNLPKMITEALEDLEGYGGGHEHACGGNIALKDFHVFAERLRKMVSK